MAITHFSAPVQSSASQAAIPLNRAATWFRPGQWTWTVPAGVTEIAVTAVGGGGGLRDLADPLTQPSQDRVCLRGGLLIGGGLRASNNTRGGLVVGPLLGPHRLQFPTNNVSTGGSTDAIDFDPNAATAVLVNNAAGAANIYFWSEAGRLNVGATTHIVSGPPQGFADAAVRGQSALVGFTSTSATLRATANGGANWSTIAWDTPGRVKYLIDAFVAVGANAITWGANPTQLTSQTIGSSLNLRSVARSTSRWVAVGADLRSGPTPATMVARAPSPAASGAWMEVEWFSGVFIGATAAGWLYRSTDGDAWTRVHQMPHGLQRGCIAHDGTVWLVVSEGGSAARSTDGGATWAACSAPTDSVTSTMATALASSDFGAIASRSQVTLDGGLTWIARPSLISGDGSATRILRGTTEIVRVGAGGVTVNGAVGHCLVAEGGAGLRSAPPSLAQLLLAPSAARWAGASGVSGTGAQPGAAVFGPSGPGSGADQWTNGTITLAGAAGEAVVRSMLPVTPGEVLRLDVGVGGGAMSGARCAADGAVMLEWRQ
ncbi:MAG: hypothetical protein EAZ99_04080 [Alphaproteobacteria bacterium]|nr:MAG: hypothetical protein EAZ99_04080 [Alphaproteobacteria bacterium]